VRQALAFGLVLFAMGCCVGQATGCGPLLTQERAVAEGAYGAALLACVDEAKTLAESKACRAKVDEQWHVVQTPRKDASQ
jgi:hypothetical protein